MESIEGKSITDIAYNFYGNIKAISYIHGDIEFYSLKENGTNEEWKKISTLNQLYPPLRLEFAGCASENILVSCGIEGIIFYSDRSYFSTNNPFFKRIGEIESLKDGINDISFFPLENIFLSPLEQNFKLAYVTHNGKLKIYEFSEICSKDISENIFQSFDVKITLNCNSTKAIDVCNTGCSSVCLSTSPEDIIIIAVGCKGSSECIKFYYDNKKNDYIDLKTSIKNEEKNINIKDIQFCEQMAKDYMILASISSDNKLDIWKIEINLENKD
ncbi:MAG: hypothetical protein MJ252_21055, partial [archaeon]|nr:hypothetical protein [archaeon]